MFFFFALFCFTACVTDQSFLVKGGGEAEGMDLGSLFCFDLIG